MAEDLCEDELDSGFGELLVDLEVEGGVGGGDLEGVVVDLGDFGGVGEGVGLEGGVGARLAVYLEDAEEVVPVLDEQHALELVGHETE